MKTKIIKTSVCVLEPCSICGFQRLEVNKAQAVYYGYYDGYSIMVKILLASPIL